MTDSRTKMFRAMRWGAHDRYFGPFTWSYSKSYPHMAIVLKSAGDEDSDGRCSLRISIGKGTLITVLPAIVRPWREKVYPKWDAKTIKRLGRDWYWNVDARQYGFSLNEGHLSVYFGRCGGSCMDSSIQQEWSCLLPWTQWRHVRYSLYGLAGEHVYTRHEGQGWDAQRAAKDACPTVQFLIEDFDGEQIIATTMIEEREWRFGTGWFKWLSWFRPTKIRRSLDISFSKETGREKGSWKGGTVGTGIDMLPGEDHETAFRRYCDEEHRSKSGKYKITFAPKAGR